MRPLLIGFRQDLVTRTEYLVQGKHVVYSEHSDIVEDVHVKIQ